MCWCLIYVEYTAQSKIGKRFAGSCPPPSPSPAVLFVRLEIDPRSLELAMAATPPPPPRCNPVYLHLAAGSSLLLGFTCANLYK